MGIEFDAILKYGKDKQLDRNFFFYLSTVCVYLGRNLLIKDDRQGIFLFIFN